MRHMTGLPHVLQATTHAANQRHRPPMRWCAKHPEFACAQSISRRRPTSHAHQLLVPTADTVAACRDILQLCLCPVVSRCHTHKQTWSNRDTPERSRAGLLCRHTTASRQLQRQRLSSQCSQCCRAFCLETASLSCTHSSTNQASGLREALKLPPLTARKQPSQHPTTKTRHIVKSAPWRYHGAGCMS